MAQKREVITYLHESKIDFNGDLDTTTQEEEDDFLLGDLKAFLDATTQPRTAYLTCWRQDDDVVMIRKDDDGLQQTYFDVHKLLFKVVNGDQSAQQGKGDTTVMPWNFRADPHWQVTYNITKTARHKNILGYSCTLYTVEEIKITERHGQPDKRNISIWATDAIKPAVSTHAVLALYDKVLEALTPLEVDIKRAVENGATFQKLRAIQIQP